MKAIEIAGLVVLCIGVFLAIWAREKSNDTASVKENKKYFRILSVIVIVLGLLGMVAGFYMKKGEEN